MKIKLDNEQYEFLKNELGIEKEDNNRITSKIIESLDMLEI